MATGVLTLQQTANPGAAGANLARYYANMSNRPCVVFNDGTEQVIPTMTAAGPLSPVSNGNNSLGSSNVGFSKLFLDYNITATVGNVTINKSTGRVIVANAATSVTVTCNLCTENSLVFALPASNDATGSVKNVVANSGNFVINCVAPSANMPVNFLIVGAD